MLVGRPARRSQRVQPRGVPACLNPVREFDRSIAQGGARRAIGLLKLSGVGGINQSRNITPHLEPIEQRDARVTTGTRKHIAFETSGGGDGDSSAKPGG